jgi:hypothetical protein
MRKTYIVLLFALFHLNSVEAQQKMYSSIQRLHKSELWTSEQDYLKGALFELKDSYILFSNSLAKDDYYNGDYIVSKILIEEIKYIKYKLSGTTGRGMLWGAVIGVGTGITIGLIDGDDWLFTRGEKAVSAGVSLGVIGALMGGLIGNIKIEIPINGSMDMYARKKKKLYKHTVKYSGK